MPDDHSELVPPLPIPNRTVKRLHANDSADSRVKVGNRQAPHLLLASPQLTETPPQKGGVFAFMNRSLALVSVFPMLVRWDSKFRVAHQPRLANMQDRRVRDPQNR